VRKRSVFKDRFSRCGEYDSGYNVGICQRGAVQSSAVVAKKEEPSQEPPGRIGGVDLIRVGIIYGIVSPLSGTDRVLQLTFST
jgi:hypothetical protein